MTRIEKTRETWRAIEAAVYAADYSRGLFHFTMSAWQNAGETEGVKFDSDAFYVCCFDSLGGLLADDNNTDAHEFFIALGVSF